MLLGFITFFSIALIVTIGVTFIWNFIFHKEAKVDWETSFLFAIIFGIILPIIDERKKKD